MHSLSKKSAFSLLHKKILRVIFHLKLVFGVMSYRSKYDFKIYPVVDLTNLEDHSLGSPLQGANPLVLPFHTHTHTHTHRHTHRHTHSGPIFFYEKLKMGHVQFFQP